MNQDGGIWSSLKVSFSCLGTTLFLYQNQNYSNSNCFLGRLDGEEMICIQQSKIPIIYIVLKEKFGETLETQP